MTPVQEAICRVISECGGWPRSDSQMKRIEDAMRKCSVHTFSASWHSVTVDSNRVIQQAYKQWEQMNEKI